MQNNANMPLKSSENSNETGCKSTRMTPNMCRNQTQIWNKFCAAALEKVVNKDNKTHKCSGSGLTLTGILVSFPSSTGSCLRDQPISRALTEPARTRKRRKSRKGALLESLPEALLMASHVHAHNCWEDHHAWTNVKYFPSFLLQTSRRGAPHVSHILISPAGARALTFPCLFDAAVRFSCAVIRPASNNAYSLPAHRRNNKQRSVSSRWKRDPSVFLVPPYFPPRKAPVMLPRGRIKRIQALSSSKLCLDKVTWPATT